jgi:hypothetical protein
VIANPERSGCNPLPGNTSGETPPPVARQLPAALEIDPDLARLLAAWPSLPPAIRRAVLALLDAVPDQ